jgi:hypothetical protein
LQKKGKELKLKEIPSVEPSIKEAKKNLLPKEEIKNSKPRK